MAFWYECFLPDRHGGIDINPPRNSPYFQRYLSDRKAQDKVRLFWNTSQDDRGRIFDIAQNFFGDSIDLVIDDASHLYSPTKASFELLFPVVRPGGIYIIEDWAWNHWKEFQGPSHPWAIEKDPTRLVFELVESAGTSGSTIASISLCSGFVAIERGDASIPKHAGWRPPDAILRRPKLQRERELVRRAIEYRLGMMRHRLGMK